MKSLMKYNEAKGCVCVCVQRFNRVLSNKTMSQQALETVVPPASTFRCRDTYWRPLIKFFLKPGFHICFSRLEPGTLNVSSPLFFFDTMRWVNLIGLQPFTGALVDEALQFINWKGHF